MPLIWQTRVRGQREVRYRVEYLHPLIQGQGLIPARLALGRFLVTVVRNTARGSYRHKDIVLSIVPAADFDEKTEITTTSPAAAIARTRKAYVRP